MSKIITLFILILGLSININVHAASQNDLAHFVILSDIHFDPFLTCTTRPCALIETLKRTPAKNWDKILSTSEKMPSSFGEDSNYILIKTSLHAAKKVAIEQQAKFVLVLGDFLAHHYHEKYINYSADRTAVSYQAFVHKTLEFINNQLEQTFNQTDIYMVVGNNDSYIGDYASYPKGKFFKDTGLIWSKLIKNSNNRFSMNKNFSLAGYYAIPISNNPKIKLIVLNTNLFSYKAQGKNINEAAEEELNWLHQQLSTAKENHEKVWIAMHIPMGIDVFATLKIHLFTMIELWNKSYMQRFQAEMKEFSSEILAIFAGHLHSDWFQVLNAGINEIPVIGTPAISPIYLNNPGFKLYTYSKQNGQIQDFITYYYSLNSLGIWQQEYDFNHVYQPNCLSCTVKEGMNLLKSNNELVNAYTTYYSVSNPNQLVITKWYPYYWCAIHEIESNKYKDCWYASRANA